VYGQARPGRCRHDTRTNVDEGHRQQQRGGGGGTETGRGDTTQDAGHAAAGERPHWAGKAALSEQYERKPDS
jgi:hypothetical protein